MALSKRDLRYWKQKNNDGSPRHLKFHSRIVDGAEWVDPNYSVRISYNGRRERFQLNTPNQQAAAAKAGAIYGSIVDHGWEAALEEHKPSKARKTAKKSAEFPPTVGGLIRASASVSTVRAQTHREYAKALRKIAGDIAGQEEQEKRESVSLDVITPESLLAWRNGFLKSHGTASKERKSPAISLNSLVRNAKALFAQKLRKHLASRISIPLPFLEAFDEFEALPEPSLRYQSRIDAEEILAAAETELAGPKRDDESPKAYEDRMEVHKALILCLVLGLRRSEADWLLWKAFDFPRHRVHIESSEVHQLKSADSAGEIDLSPRLAQTLRGYSNHCEGRFVLQSISRLQHQNGSRTYRCNRTFEALAAWLRSKGVADRKPIHVLRKEIGSLIAARDGIFAASRYARHSDIRITSRIYADKKNIVVAPLKAFE